MSLLIVFVLAYPAGILALYLGTFLAGMAGVSEVRLPRAVGRPLALVLRPVFGGRTVDAVTSGPCTLFLNAPTPDLVLHEGYHRYQALVEAPGRHVIVWADGHVAYDAWPSWPARLIGCVVYGVKYNIETMRRGYWQNRYEIAARHAAGQDAQE